MVQREESQVRGQHLDTKATRGLVIDSDGMSCNSDLVIENAERGASSAEQACEANHEVARTSCQSHRSRTPITATSTTFCNEGTRQALTPTVGAKMIEGGEELMMEGAEELIEEARK